MQVPDSQREIAKSRLEKIAEIYWGPRIKGRPNELKLPYTDWSLILESVIKDYALVGKEALGKIIQCAQQRLREKYAPKS